MGGGGNSLLSPSRATAKLLPGLRSTLVALLPAPPGGHLRELAELPPSLTPLPGVLPGPLPPSASATSSPHAHTCVPIRTWPERLPCSPFYLVCFSLSLPLHSIYKRSCAWCATRRLRERSKSVQAISLAWAPESGSDPPDELRVWRALSSHSCLPLRASWLFSLSSVIIGFRVRRWDPKLEPALELLCVSGNPLSSLTFSVLMRTIASGNRI